MTTLQVTLRALDASPAIQYRINKHFKKITNFNKRLHHCHVIIEMLQKHKYQEKIFTVKIDATLPGKEIVVSKKQNPNLYIAIREGFNALEKLLNKHHHKKSVVVDKHMRNLLLEPEASISDIK